MREPNENTVEKNNDKDLNLSHIEKLNNKRVNTDIIKQIEKHILLSYSPAILYVFFNIFISHQVISAVLGITIGVVIYAKYRNHISNQALIVATPALLIGLAILYFVSSYVFIFYAMLLSIDYKYEFIRNH